MILLPTLIRKATRLDDLPYQVVPGLANARGHDMDVEEVAARVIYLTDGDKSGSDYLSDLRATNVPESRLKSLPPGTSVEDLLDRDFLISVINSLLPEGAPRPTARTFRAAWTAGRSITKWAKDKDVATWERSRSPTRSSTQTPPSNSPRELPRLCAISTSNSWQHSRRGNAAPRSPTP